MQKTLIFSTLIACFALNSIVYANGTDTLASAIATTDGKARPDTICKNEKFSYHFQTTMVGMYHPDFSAPYTGANSLLTHEPIALSVTSTLFLGTRLWKGGEIYFNPEMSGGKGFSGATGIAGFPNGEIYRVGTPTPVITIARIFLRQTFNLSQDYKNLSGGQNQLSDCAAAPDRLVFTFGKFSVTDMFDANTYSHDPRNQFMNWAIMSAGAWDYPANTRGYTYGFVAELLHPAWNLKGAVTMVPETANGPYMDLDIARAHSETLEFDKMFSLAKQPGVIRLIGFYTQGHMGSYKVALNDNAFQPNIIQTETYAHDKWGFVVNAEQQLNDNIGVFGRLSWNNGTSETWAFTEIDQSLHIGMQLKGNIWHRPTDNFGVALLLDGLSKEHRDYLAAGGYGFLIGDGQLNYGIEHVAELYYSAKLWENFRLSPDYQFLLNPAYNKDRGPVVHIFGVRGHIEF